MDKLKELPSETFKANGHEYYISQSLSVRRFREFEKFRFQYGLGIGLVDARKEVIKIFKSLNEGKVADASVTSHNMANMIERLDQDKDPVVMKLCALFINRKGEDVTAYDVQVMEEKINDWAEEGYRIEDFFTLASTLSKNFSNDLDEDSENTSQSQKES